MRAANDSVHELQLRDVKMKNRSIFTPTPAISDNRIFVEMKLTQSLIQRMQMLVIDEEVLGLEYKLDEGAYGAKHLRGHSPCNNGDDDFLKVAVFSACALLELGYPISPMTYADARL